MNQQGQAPLGFGEATGRASVCPSCRKPLPRPEGGQIALVCTYCRTETDLAPPLLSMQDVTLRLDLMIHEPANATANSIEAPGIDDEFEIKLEPVSERVAPSPSLTQWQTNAALPDPTVIDRDRSSSPSPFTPAALDSETRSDQAKLSYNESAGLYPRERHYPTLEAMQRLYKLFGYVAVLIVFPYIGFRFLYLLATTKEQHLQVFAEFSEFAVPVLFGCVAFTASLFAASEGIRLAMDIQENTLRIANNSGRRKVN